MHDSYRPESFAQPQRTVIPRARKKVPTATPPVDDELWKAAKDYVVAQGWEILEYYESGTYTITLSGMVSSPEFHWCTGFVDPLPLCGSVIQMRGMRVKGHPVDLRDDEAYSTSIQFDFVDRQLVNGMSSGLDENAEGFEGGGYALDGSAYGPIIGEMSCREFVDDLRKRIHEAYPRATLDPWDFATQCNP